MTTHPTHTLAVGFTLATQEAAMNEEQAQPTVIDNETSRRNLEIRKLFDQERAINGALERLDDIQQFFMFRGDPGGAEFDEAIDAFRAKLAEARQAVWDEQMKALPYNQSDDIPF